MHKTGVTVYLTPLGSLPPGGQAPALGSLTPTPENLANSIQNDIYFFFITNLYHTIIRTVVMYVFHYFTLYGRGLGLRYCSLSIFLPNSEVLADTVQKDILSLLIEFPIEQVIREFPVSDITYLLSNRKGQGIRYPDLRMVVVPAFTYFFHFMGRDWGQNTVAQEVSSQAQKIL